MVVVVMARFVPAQEAVRVKVALGLLDGHGDDSPTGQTGRPAALVWVGFTAGPVALLPRRGTDAWSHYS
jgi:hypothetical protein